jgi:hypothetical protein
MKFTQLDMLKSSFVKICLGSENVPAVPTPGLKECFTHYSGNDVLCFMEENGATLQEFQLFLM